MDIEYKTIRLFVAVNDGTDGLSHVEYTGILCLVVYEVIAHNSEFFFAFYISHYYSKTVSS